MMNTNTERLDHESVDPKAAAHEEAAPPNRRVPEKLGDIDQAAATTFEGEIREFVRRDIALSRRQRRHSEAEQTQAEPADNNLNTLIRRVAGASIQEIDRVIGDLQGLREMLRNEGERVSREVSGYASLSHAAMTAMKVIGDSLAQWKSAPNRSGSSTASER